MPGPLQQLHYTWTPRGVEGVNRFQIAGMSAGFKAGEAAGALSTARALCRYEVPRDEQSFPVSFGWADQGPYRIAFQRVGLPAGTDRAGNFAAHLLVGSPGAMPEAEIAASFGSPLWWRGLTSEERVAIEGGKRDFELPTVELEELSATAPALGGDREGLMALIYQLATASPDEQIAVSEEGEVLAQALAAVARLLPQLLTGFTVSTYEAKAVYPFRLVGTSAPTTQMRACDLRLPPSLDDGDIEVLRRLTDEDSASAELRDVVGRSGREGGAGAAAKMWETARLLVGFESGREVTAQMSDALLADPEVAGFLARSREGRSNLARWVQAGGAAVLRGVKTAGERMETTCREALYLAVGDRYAEAAELRGSAAAVESMATGPARQQVLDQVLEVARKDGAAATLGPEDAMMVMERAAERALDPVTMRPLLRGALRYVDLCAAQRAIPDSYLAAMFEIALGDAPAPLSRLSAAIRGRPRFLESVELDGAEAGRCIDLLQRVDLDTRAAALRSLLPALLQSDARTRVVPLVMSMPPELAAQTTLAAAPAHLPASDVTSEICDTLGAILLDQRKSGLAKRLLGESRSDDALLATALLRRLADGAGSGPATIALEAGAIHYPELRRALRRLALDHARTGSRSLAAVEDLWRALAEIYPQEDEPKRLKRLLGLGAAPPSSPAGAVILAWIAGRLLDEDCDLVGMLGSMKDDEVEAAAAAVAASVEPWRLAEAGASLGQAPKRARRWWRRIEAQSEKAHAQKR